MLPQLISNKRDPLKKSYEKFPAANKEKVPEYETQNYYNSSKQVRSNPKSRSSQKVRTGGGFNKKTPQEQYEQSFNKNISAAYTNDRFVKFQKLKNSGNNLAAQIKMIQRKIKACQKKIQEDKKRQRMLAEQATRDKDQPQYDFEQIVRREMQMQGYYQTDEKEYGHNFDYLTNPGGKQATQQEQKEQIPEPVPLQKPYNIEEGVEKLQKHYENNLKKKFQRRQMFPHQACRRKTPKLFISHKTNTVNKYGRALNEAEHMFRVYTKETTPQQIYPTIPNFAVVKDNLSKNIVAYLGDYKPFLEKTKNQKAEDENSSNYQDNMRASQNQRDSKPNTGMKSSRNKQDFQDLEIEGQQIERV